MSDQDRHVTLNNGVEMPILGFGVFQIPADETEQAVTDALAAGYRPHRHRRRLRQRGGRRPGHRDQRHPARRAVRHHQAVGPGRPGEDNTQRAFDAVAAHARPRLPRPVPDPPALRRLLRRVARHGGASTARAGPGRSGSSNFYPDRLVDLIVHNEVAPAVNQIETHPFFQRADRPAADARARRAARVLGPLRRGPERPVHRPDPERRSPTRTASRVAQVVLRWLIQRGVVAIPKSVRPERMARELRRLRLRAHRRPDGAHRHAGHRRLAVLRPPRPRRWSAGVSDVPRYLIFLRRRLGAGCPRPPMLRPLPPMVGGSGSTRINRDSRTEVVSCFLGIHG